jgi:hypothetical protein
MEARTMLTIIAPVQANDPTGTGPVAAVMGDLNGDGRTDLVVANRTAGTISVMLGNGNGSLQNKVDYTVGATPNGLVLGDFNGGFDHGRGLPRHDRGHCPYLYGYGP